MEEVAQHTWPKESQRVKNAEFFAFHVPDKIIAGRESYREPVISQCCAFYQGKLPTPSECTFFIQNFKEAAITLLTESAPTLKVFLLLRGGGSTQDLVAVWKAAVLLDDSPMIPGRLQEAAHEIGQNPLGRPRKLFIALYRGVLILHPL